MAFFANLWTLLLVFLGINEDPNAYNSKFTYPCSVNNCQQCSYTNFCGLCDPNFILTINPITSKPYCKLVTCTVANCQQCYNDNICQICNSGYYVTSSGKCSRLQYTCSVSNCLACSSSDQNTCQLCQYGYYLSSINNECYPISGNQVQNCQVAFSHSSYLCQVCDEGYLVNPAYQCHTFPTFSCDVNNCLFCTSSNYCGECENGFNMTNGGCSLPLCNIQNCAVCSNSSQCTSCTQNYAISNNKCLLKAYGCAISNCLLCAEYPQICTRCEVGYRNVYIYSSDNTTLKIGSKCQLITGSVGGLLPVTNCDTFGAMAPGFSELSIGCISCKPNFYNIGGYCVANLGIYTYQCDIANCIYCIGNNVCGKCQYGYTNLLGSFSKCIKAYSPFSNCQQTAPFEAACAQCSSSYILSTNLTCIKNNQDVSCQIQGCNYCLEDKICAACRTGFTYVSKSNSCSPICSISNCYQCQSSTLCEICESGYILAAGSTECDSIEQDPSTECSAEVYGQGCSECQDTVCLSCLTNYTLNPQTQKCCPTPLQDALGCEDYLGVCSNQCEVCKNGYNKFVNNYGQETYQCVTPAPCTIPNCLFCPQQKCQVCAQGYLLNGTGTCVGVSNGCSSSVQFCLKCNSANQCTQCQSGYLLYYGQCVCPMQNCLKCESNAFCTVCPFPTLSLGNKNIAGCSLPFVPFVQCQIQACQQCMLPNVCSVCSQGYSLSTKNTCILNNCSNFKNCNLCNSNQLICYQCSNGYIQTFPLYGACQYLNNQTNKNCQQVISFCAYCDNSGTQSTCQQCLLGYHLESGKCLKNVCTENCMFCPDSETALCFACYTGYYLDNNNTCSLLEGNFSTSICFDDIPNCVECVSQYECGACASGLQLSSDNQECVPAICSVDNCAFCLDGTDNQQCAICRPGYTLTSIGLCSPMINYPANIQCDQYSCFQCYANNSCAQCAAPFIQYEGSCLSNINCPSNCLYCQPQSFCTICQQDYKVNTNQQLSIESCVPDCPVENCLLCATTIQCQKCSSLFVLSQNSDECICGPNFQTVNGQCECPESDGFYLSGNQCFNCSLDMCTECSNNNFCVACSSGFQASNGKCQCPETFVIQQNTCQCPQDYTYETESNQCIECPIQNCAYCSENNVCAQCILGLLVIEGQCVCPDNHVTVNGICQCPTGTSPYQAQCYECSVDYCQQCSSNNSCSSCIYSFTLNDGACSCQPNFTAYKSQCILCESYYVNQCQYCSSQNYCEQCEESFINEDGQCFCPSNTTYSQELDKCLLCEVDNCNLCSANSSAECETCRIGTTLSDGLCILCDIDNCYFCTSDMFCASCSQGLEPSAQGDLCINCDISNCLSCSSDSICQVCAPSYVLIPGTYTCVKCVLEGCSVCYTTNVCSSCVQGYQLQSTGVCTPCPYPCQTCNTLTPSECITCKPPYALDAYSNGNCYMCQILYCQKCQELNKCTACFSGYKLSNNTCLQIIHATQACQIYSNSQCIQCYEHYALVNGKCQSCIDDNCKVCNPDDLNICIDCVEGFYNAEGICQYCPFPNCLQCDSKQCFSYLPAFNQFAILFNQQIMPVVCDPGCSQCSQIQPTYCLQCAPGYALYQQDHSSYCLPCQYPCLTCSSTSPQQCYSCASTYQLQVNTQGFSQCVSCQTSLNCFTCSLTMNQYCTTCPLTFLQSTSCSTSCNENMHFCLQCNEAAVCKVCADGYSNTPDGNCVPCLVGCSKCSYQVNVCTQCLFGYYMFGSTCYQCNSDLQCQTCSGRNMCTSCYDGYTLIGNHCLKKCSSSCATCQSSAGCTSCIAGYILQKNQLGSGYCTPDIKYFQEKRLNSYCPSAYALSAGYCQACQFVSNFCMRCDPSNLTKCIACQQGYYLELATTVCEPCPKGCETCTNSKTCLSCESGYAQLSQSVTLLNKQCHPCVYPCSTCRDTPITCMSCEAGYSLLGTQCMGANYFAFSVELNTDMNTFWQNYTGFLTDITLSLNYDNFYNISIVKILSGSVIVVGIIQAQSPDVMSYQQQYENLLNLFENGSPIAGFQVISSQLGNSFDFYVTSTNTGLIVGLVVGFSLLFAVIAACLMAYYKRKRTEVIQVSNTSRKQTNMTINSNIRDEFLPDKSTPFQPNPKNIKIQQDIQLQEM